MLARSHPDLPTLTFDVSVMPFTTYGDKALLPIRWILHGDTMAGRTTRIASACNVVEAVHNALIQRVRAAEQGRRRAGLEDPSEDPRVNDERCVWGLVGDSKQKEIGVKEQPLRDWTGGCKGCETPGKVCSAFERNANGRAVAQLVFPLEGRQPAAVDNPDDWVWERAEP
jgi:hypothetical protein